MGEKLEQWACAICGTESPMFSWTDTHGVAQCKCGTPYTAYHYENGARVDLPPAIAIKPEYVPVLKAYWEQTQRIIHGGFSFDGGYERASNEDARAFYAWMGENAGTIIAGGAPSPSIEAAK
jgi:hypothetical protein